ncbi:DNA invertase Pin-like site-specific DNA recombinase [Brevundimonas vesicularis]|uniref:DNA invertase Pin-like site-specific DNA recombinase n=1 Tax=Brevundimonas vesicularis TaxID=41276 RepID=A0A7W9FX59_BREVE|nr:recombinase family protein [Brevundimonas vesicularis]MBB5773106.1 DNA invertase Pin-like site-specific DNA recombinase [Brevundimonas vesicularis]
MAYGRFSTDTQNPRSADDQIAMLCEIASKAGWQVVRSEKDEGVSGSQSDREGFMRIAEAAHNREFSVLMVEGLERLSRNRADLFQLYDNVLKPNGIRIYVARSNSIMDDTAMMLLAWKAGEDLTQLKQQVRRGQNAVITDGR